MAQDSEQTGEAVDPITAEDYATFFPELDDRGQPLVAEPDRTPWPPLRPGEKVRLELEVTVGHPLGEDLIYFGLAQDGGKTVSLYLPVDHPQVRVTRAEPADGVPQPGELWADQVGTRRLFAYHDEDDPVLRLMDEYGRSMSWEIWHRSEAYGPIRRLMTAEQIASYR